jgi:hypothetical protein
MKELPLQKVKVQLEASLQLAAKEHRDHKSFLLLCALCGGE